MELAVVGNGDFIIGFKLAGIRTVFETNETNYEATLLDVLHRPEFGILVVWDDDLKRLRPSVRQRVQDSIQPVVVAIGRTDVSDLRERIRRTIGVDLYAEGNAPAPRLK